MQKVLSAEEMREVDRLTTERYGIPSLILMENAAHAAARVIAEKLGGSVEGKSFLILCGKGNNGGDGAALARVLAVHGAFVDLVLFGKIEDTKGDAKANFEIVRKLAYVDEEEQYFTPPQFLGSTIGVNSRGQLSFNECQSPEYFHNEIILNAIGSDHDVIIDALFGTGLTRPLDKTIDYAVNYINQQRSISLNENEPLIVSIDIPSGLIADSSKLMMPSVLAHICVTFTAPKTANVVPPASNCNDETATVDIGSPKNLIENSPSQTFLTEKADVLAWLEKTEFSSASYKNKRGHALLVAGSDKYAGAAVLAGNAAIVSGVGLVTIATARSAQNTIASRVLPEVMTRGLPETESGAVAEDAFSEIMEFVESSIDAVEIGSGLGTDESTRLLIKKMVEERQTPIVIDADALTALAPFEIKGDDENPLILTPHAGEFLKLLGTDDKDAAADRVAVAREFARKHHVILVMKGERALVAAPDGRVCINPTGNSGLGKAGNGDTLAGIITGFVAQAVQMKVDIFETIVAAVYLAGLAGDIAAAKIGKRSMLASDVRECLTDAFHSITN